MTPVERAFAVTIFPLTMAAAVAGCMLAMDAGMDPASVVGVATGLAGLWVFALERVMPLHESWLHSKGDLTTDIAHVINITGVTAILVTPASAYLGVTVFGALSERFGAGPWRADWAILAQLPIALIVAEFPKYWNHRLQHSIDFLWRFHATHHSAPRLYWLNAGRFHPVDTLIDGILGSALLVAIGCGIEIIALFTLVSGVHGFFQHANLKLRLGPLNYFFSMAELHRWHHSPVLEEANNNYGQNLSVWDWVFGTFFLPKDREPPEEIGIPNLPAFPMRFWPQMASPFNWARIKAESARD